MKTKTDPKNVGAAVIGLGRGKAHVRSYAKAAGCDLLAVCDLVEERARASAEEFGCDWYTDYHDLLARDDIDLISVCVPSGDHCALAMEIARAGKNCLSEKPLDVTLEAIDEAVAEFDRVGLKLGCIFQNRLEDAIQLTKKAVADGLLGELVVANVAIKWYRTDEYYKVNGGWRGTWAMDGGGSLMNQSVHTIDILQWLMGEPEMVFGQTRVANHNIESEDIGCALVRFKNGGYATITGSTACYPGFGTSIEIHGTRGGICVKDNQIVSWKIDRHYGEAATPEQTEQYKQEMAAEEAEMIAKTAKKSKANGSSDPLAIPADTTFTQVQDMVDAVRDGRQPVIRGEEGRKAVRLILAIYESSRTGAPVQL